jgi:hypothetical protein
MVETTTDRELLDLVDAWVKAQAPRSRAEAVRQRSSLSVVELAARDRLPRLPEVCSGGGRGCLA